MARVLIVDDEDDIRLLLRLQLAAAGHEVLESPGGAEAIATLHDGSTPRPDCLVLDLRMPQVDGWTVLDEVRQSEELAELAVLLVSAHADAKDRERSKDLGAADLLAKPVSQGDLVDAISRVVTN